MNHEAHILSIQLLDRTWQIRCPADKAPELQKCAHYLDGKIREITSQTKTLSTESLLVMAAINALYDLFAQHAQKDLYIDSLGSRIRELQKIPS